MKNQEVTITHLTRAYEIKGNTVKFTGYVAIINGKLTKIPNLN